MIGICWLIPSTWLFKTLRSVLHNVEQILFEVIFGILLFYWSHNTIVHIPFSAVDSGGAGGGRAPPEFGAKPDFCLSEFSYYYEHPWI